MTDLNGQTESAAKLQPARTLARPPRAKKKKAAEKKKPWRSNPFLQNFDHLEDIALVYLNDFIQGVKLPRDKELAYRICQVLENEAIEHEKKHKPKGMNGHGHAMAEAVEGIDIEDEEEDAVPDPNDDDGDSLYFEGLSENFPTIRASLNGSAELHRRYAGNRYKGLNRKDWKMVKDYFAAKTAALPVRGKKGAPGKNPNHENLMNLADSLGVSADERKLLEFLLATHFTSRLQRFFFEVTGADKSTRGRGPMRQCVARALGITTTRLTEILKPDGPLRNKGLLEYSEPDSPERTFGMPYINDSIQSIIQEPGITLPQMISRILGEPKTTVRAWNDFEGLGEQAARLRQFVEGRIRERKGANILLVGSVGLGKSDIVKALCKELKLPLYIPGEDASDINDMDGRPLPPSKVRFDAWHHGISLLSASTRESESRRFPSAMLLDEVGDLLETNAQGRQTDGSYAGGNLSRLDLHETIENSGVITFFAGNDNTKWDAGFLSRMDLAILLRTPDYAYSRTIWNTVVKEHGMQRAFTEGDIEKLAGELEISPRLMQKAVAFAKTVEGGLPEAMFFLEQQCTFLYDGIENVRTRSPDAAPFHPELMALELPEKMAPEVFLRRMDAAKSKPVTMLLGGPDGTGKRLLAQRFAELTGRRTRTVVMEDVLGKGYDDTRARVSQIFEQAGRDGVVLQLFGMDPVISARVAAENPNVDFACRHIADELKRSKVPAVMLTRHEHREHIAGDIATAFTLYGQLGFLKEPAVARGIELLAGKRIPAATRETEVTPADIDHAVRQMQTLELPEEELGGLIDASVKARRSAPTTRIGFHTR